MKTSNIFAISIFIMFLIISAFPQIYSDESEILKTNFTTLTEGENDMSVLNPNNAIANAILGPVVERALATLPQTTNHALFTIGTGRILLTQLVGEVTTVIQTQANDTKLTATPTIGTAVDICAALDISADEAGCLYGISGLNTDALIGINAGALPGQWSSVVLPIGTLNLACAASNTGAVKWSARWIPLDLGATFVAA